MDGSAVVDVTKVIPASVDDVGRLWAQIQEIVTVWGLKVIAAVAIFIVGRWIAMFMRRVIRRLMERANVESIITGFVSSIAYIALLAFVVIAALGQLGIQTTSFIAVLGAAGLAIGLALQGSLANFAAGFLMIIFRPFKVGDFIEGAGISGSVDSIGIFSTVLKTPDNRVITVPNSLIYGTTITNYSAESRRRVDLLIGISYDDDIGRAKALIQGAIARESRVLEEPASQLLLMELGASSVDIAVRVWVATSDYWNVRSDLLESIKKTLEGAGLSIPYPQRDIHIVSSVSGNV
jgi:small conductance mechanosensitive channel